MSPSVYPILVYTARFRVNSVVLSGPCVKLLCYVGMVVYISLMHSFLGRVGSVWVRGLGLGLANPVGTWKVWDVCLCLGYGGVGGGMGGLGQYLGGCCGFIYVCVVSLNYVCRWQVQVSVYCDKRTHAHLMYTHC